LKKTENNDSKKTETTDNDDKFSEMMKNMMNLNVDADNNNTSDNPE